MPSPDDFERDSDRTPDITQLSPGERLRLLKRRTSLMISFVLAIVFSVATAFVSFHAFHEGRSAREQAKVQLDATRAAITGVTTSADGAAKRWADLAAFEQNIADPGARAAFREQVNAGLAEAQGLSKQSKLALSLFEAVVMENASRRVELPSLLRSAQAAPTGTLAEGAPRDNSIDAYRPYVYLGLLAAIALFFFGCLGIYAFSGNREKIKFASDMMKTVVGFWIGIITGWAGGR